MTNRRGGRRARWRALSLVGLAVAALALVASALAAPPSITESQKLTPVSPPPLSYSLGRDLGVDGDVLAAIAPWAQGDGFLHVYREVAGSFVAEEVVALSPYEPVAVAVSDEEVAVGLTSPFAAAIYDAASGWDQQILIPTPEPTNHTRFGWTIDLVGDLLVVGAPLDDDAATWAGAVYAYERDGDAWSLAMKLLGPAAPTGGQMASSLATDGTRIVAGAPGAGRGEAHVFAKVDGQWELEGRLLPGTDSNFDRFGRGVAVDGDWIAVGSDYFGERRGRVLMYQHQPDGWMLSGVLSVEWEYNASFGLAVDLEVDRLLVGEDLGGARAVHEFRLQGTDWVPTRRLQPSDYPSPSAFGEALALSGTIAAAGSPVDDDAATNAGAVYVFDLANPPPTPPDDPLVIFVQGIGSSWDCSAIGADNDVLGLFERVVEPLLPGAELRIFSYSGNYEPCGTRIDPLYEAPVTCGSIDTEDPLAPGHSERFQQWYEIVAADRSDVYVLAHSMGGVVSTYALSQWEEVPPSLRGIITLDSPLAGRVDIQYFRGCGVLDPPALDDLDPDERVIKAIQGLTDERLRYVTSIANNEDLVVPPSNSHLPDAWLNFRIDDNCDPPLQSPYDHACVFDNARADSAIATSLLNALAADDRQPPSLEVCLGMPANVIGSHGDDNLFLEGDNQLRGGTGHDVIAGLGGDDGILAGPGNDRICGGDGNDLIEGQTGDDIMQGGPDDDDLMGGPNRDTVDYADAPGAVTVNLTTRTATGAAGTDFVDNVENIVGSAFGDTLRGNAKRNVIWGGDGDDGIQGLGGDDELYGEGDDDNINGRRGNDLLHGGPGTDQAAFLHSPNPAAVDLAISDPQATGDGTDTLVGIENLLGSRYADTLWGNGQANVIKGARGGDSLFGRGGDDLLIGNTGIDVGHGGGGTDTCRTEVKIACE